MRGHPLPTRPIAVGLGICAAAMLGGAAARAEQVAYPKADARVELDVPKDWRVDYTPFGLELAAPDKKSFIVAGLVKPNAKAIDAWAKEAAERMRSFGLTIDAKAKASAPKAAMPPMTVLNLPKDRTAFTFSGTPSIDILPEAGGPTSKDRIVTDTIAKDGITKDGIAKDGIAKDAAPIFSEAPSSAPASGTPLPKIPFKSVQYLGASLQGKPFDLQLIIYKVSSTEDFLVEQTSGAEDPRAAAIVTSAKIVK